MLYVLKFYLQGSPRERGDHGTKLRNSFSTQFLSYWLTAQSNR